MMLVELAVSRLPGGSLKWELPLLQCEFDGGTDSEITTCTCICTCSCQVYVHY
jgi:hypothetical protein